MLLLSHFGERFDPAQCHGTCDTCSQRGVTSLEETDVTDLAQKMIATVMAIQQQVRAAWLRHQRALLGRLSEKWAAKKLKSSHAAISFNVPIGCFMSPGILLVS